MEEALRLTDLDYLVSDHRLQMIKAALPYMGVSEQAVISMFVKVNELNNTIKIFRENDEGMLGICSIDQQSVSPLNMLKSVREYANTNEQEFIDLICNFMQSTDAFSIMEQVKKILPADEQAKFDNYQLIMQALQQIT